MKFAADIEINRPLSKVIELFDNPENMKLWMEGLQSFEALSGKPGHPGAKSRLLFKMGSREVEMIETIIVRDLPKEFSGTYEAKGVWNMVTNRFVSIAPDRTKYLTEQEFKFSGFLRIIAFLMPGVFKSQSMKYLAAFKQFAEKS